MREGQKRDLARALRRNATEAERIMWRLLRDRRLAGAKFRRQVPIGPFIADFASIAHRLVVELDGGQHAENEADARRDGFLAANGWRVMRFWNNDVMTIVTAFCRAFSKGWPSPRPSPASGRGGYGVTVMGWTAPRSASMCQDGRCHNPSP